MNIFRHTSLQRKLTWVILLTAVTTLLLAVMALLVLEISEFKDSLSREIRSVAGVIGANSKAALEFDDGKAGTQTLSVLHDDPRIISAALYTADGRVFATYESEGSQGTVPMRYQLGASRDGNSGILIREPIYHDGRTVGAIMIRAADRQVYERLERQLLIVLVVLVISGAAAYFIAAFLGNVISRPILSLASTAEHISLHNDYSVRAIKESDDETGMLVDSFNQMVTEIGQKTAALRDSEHQLRLITDSLPVLISYVDAEGRYQFNNAAYESWFNKLPADLKGRSIRDALGPEIYDSFEAHVRTALSGELVRFEGRLTHARHGPRYIAGLLVPDFDYRQQVRGYFSLITDISDRKQAEDDLKLLNEQLEARVVERTRQLKDSQERLRNSERLASIGTLAAGIAHEIRNPLNSILLITQVAGRYRGEVPKPIRDMFESVTTEAKRCAAIIKNVLLFAKAERTERTLQDVNEVIKHAVDLAKSYLGPGKTEVFLHLQDDPLPAELNSTEFEQVLINLINNASESSPGQVRIDISTVEIDQKVRITVSDNGPGIPEDILKHIFDPFFSTKRQKGNTGLGLSLSHGIIADHGGIMNVESTVGQGTTFTIELGANAA